MKIVLVNYRYFISGGPERYFFNIKEEFEKNATCFIYNNGNCPYISKYKTDKSYDCKTAPWLVVKGEKQAMCPYAVAAHSLGLWQNDLDINF